MAVVLRVLALVVLVAACTESSPETQRVRAHLEGALAEVAAHHPVLAPAQQAARARALADLRAYIDAEAYPTNDVVPEMTPIFIDRFGARCAMAALIEASGHRALVQRIARDHLYAHIADLAADAELGRWLADHGLTLAEAARIQPGYANTRETRWKPTASAVLTGQLEVADYLDGDGGGAFLAGVRIGARRITETVDACDQCVYTTTAFFAEYQRRLAPSGEGANVVGALMSYDLGKQAEDRQWYLLGGAVAEVGDHLRFGAKLGAGFSFRNRKVPILGEVALVGADHADGFAVHLALTTGAVW